MITARINEFEARPTEYFDMALNGEDVLIPRSENRNVCIISESQYNHLQEAKRNYEYISGMSGGQSSELLARSVEELRLV